MTRLLIPAAALVAALCGGCGESTSEKCNHARSQCDTLAEKFSEEVGEDGWFKRGTTEEADPWGGKLEVKYRRTRGHEALIVWSNGPDKLPHTSDDIASRRYELDNDAVLAEIAAIKSKNRQGAVENYGASLTRGLVRGGHEGWQERGRKSEAEKK